MIKYSFYAKQQSCEIFVAEKSENEKEVRSAETMVKKGFGAMHLLNSFQLVSTNIAQLCCLNVTSLIIYHLYLPPQYWSKKR